MVRRANYFLVPLSTLINYGLLTNYGISWWIENIIGQEDQLIISPPDQVWSDPPDQLWSS